MKFPSIFRTASPSRFDIKPRYYDPVKEELEQRTSRIKKELEAEGKLGGEISEDDRLKHYETGIRGAFSQHQGIRPRGGSILASTAMLRTLIFLILVGGLAGYIYIGPVIFEYLLYIMVLIAGVYFFTKLKSKAKR
ncbi:MAG: hypothetical protein HWE15_01430 [Algoriphagus sp.]|uniref:hypothetical protein n=1 Tax=Algoriphagus sp. TaxID=1872435 RepID=UPI00178D97FD|nr:hypothetical protein [Algoriphagus sp.]NVJ84933.1 hypothetical protein [Algoriphagus sp.]